MKYISKQHSKLSLFKVTYRANSYYTLIDQFDRDELAVRFAYYEQTHVKDFTGPESWLPHVYDRFSEMFKMFEVFQFEGLCLYDPKHINEIWALLKTELEDINEMCEIYK